MFKPEGNEPAIEINQAAYRRLPCPKRLVIAPGTTHLFEVPGTLKEGAVHVIIWLK
jgi:hypothetical protein